MIPLQNAYDFSIDEILSVVFIETQRDWKLSNLCFMDRWILCYSVDGEVTYTIDNQYKTIKRGDVLFIPPGKSRSATTSSFSPWKFIVIKFRLSNFNEETKGMLDSIPNIMPMPNHPIIQGFKEIELAWRTKKPSYLIKCKGLLYSIMYQVFSKIAGDAEHSKYSKLLSNVLTVIGNNVQENYSVQTLADMVDLSPSYFRTIFKEYTGFSPIQYQNYIKMHHAYDLLSCEHYSISEVAERVGISDEFYFSRLFKQVIGTPPSKLKR